MAFQLAKAVAEQLERATQRYFRYAIQGTGGTQGLYLGEDIALALATRAPKAARIQRSRP